MHAATYYNTRNTHTAEQNLHAYFVKAYGPEHLAHFKAAQVNVSFFLSFCGDIEILKSQHYSSL